MPDADIQLPDDLQGSLVVCDAQGSFRESYNGRLDGNTGEPIGEHTRFQIASVSKSFTAAAIVLLAQEGRLALHDPIDRWIDASPASWQAITIHHLLTHTSGLGTWRDYPEINLSRRVEPSQLVTMFQSRPPLFKPGRRWR